MNQNVIYKHIHCQDAVFEPWSLGWYQNEDTREWHVKATGAWHNIAHKRMFFIASETIYINYNDLRKWKEYKHA